MVAKKKVFGSGLIIKKSKARGLPNDLFKNTNKIIKKYSNMNWKQVKKRFPGLNPQGDVDFDGTRNKHDCKPLDPSHDGKIADYIRKKMKERQMKKDLQRARRYTKPPERAETKIVRRVGAAVHKVATHKPIKRRKGTYRLPAGVTYTPPKTTKTKTTTGKKYATAGRPKGVYKHKDPRTGQPIPAPQYYRIVRELRRKAGRTEEMADIKEQQYMAKKYGISPQTTSAVQEAREERMAPPEQPEEEEIQTMPTQPIQNGAATIEEVQQEVSEVPEGYTVASNGQVVRQAQIQRPELKYKVIRDIMTGRPIIKPIPPRERWTY